MSMSDAAMIRAFMAGLVDRAGGVDAAAAIIGARLGHDVSKGSISKRLAGVLDWPLIEIMAIEDATNDRCVRRWLSRSLPDMSRGQGLLSLVSSLAREHGEALSAVMDFASGGGDLHKARKEVQDALNALQRLAADLDGQS